MIARLCKSKQIYMALFFYFQEDIMYKKILSGILAMTVMLSSVGCMSQSKTEDQSQTKKVTDTESKIYLDYSDGIEAGAYQWILSEDKKYYVLVSVDENGKPIEAKEMEINVGANNKEKMDKKDFSNVPQDKGNMANGKPKDGTKGERKKDGFPGNSQAGTLYQGTYTSSNITNTEYQTMLVYVPAEYFNTDSNGMVTGINETAKVGNYTAKTAPVVYLNECGGWKSSQPKACDTTFTDQGMIYVTAGARSRDAMDENGNITGKSPTQVVDLKAGIIELRANTDIIPGDMDKIISYGTSGAGQMSSILGASGNMPEYYEYMYESGVLGISKNKDGTYSSMYKDDIYAAQAYCPIADIENADLAYAWWWADLVDQGGIEGHNISDFERRLQELEADTFIDYINGLELEDSNRTKLTLTGLREGSYYDAILNNISNALNAAVAAGEIDVEKEYSNYENWMQKKEDGTYQITSLPRFMVATGLVNQRNKAIPGFDSMDKSSENDAFGNPDQNTVHYSSSVAKILKDNYEELSSLQGFPKEEVDSYIEEALEGETAVLVEKQTNLMNGTEILLGTSPYKVVDPAKYWRVRSGTADQHTSFTIGYNICLSAEMMSLNTDYHLVWNMVHGSKEGTSTGTFIEWIQSIV